MKPTTGSLKMADGATLLIRWLLGGLFLYMGLQKALHPVEFLKLVRQYDLVPGAFWLNFVAASLPWFEIFCALLLITGVAVRGTALLLLGMLVPFTLLVLRQAWLIQGVQAIPFCAVKFDCGCGMGEVYICHKLAENILLTLLSAWLLAGRGQQCCLRYRLF